MAGQDIQRFLKRQSVTLLFPRVESLTIQRMYLDVKLVYPSCVRQNYSVFSYKMRHLRRRIANAMEIDIE